MSVNAINSTQKASTYLCNETNNKKSAPQEEQKLQAISNSGVVYEKSEMADNKATYSINRMSDEDRELLVKQMQADLESRQQSLVNIVKDMMNGQVKSYSIATEDDSIWKFLANGDFTVDAETKAKAQEDISEDGYWGVKQTSQRLFDFASALAGDDVDKMKEMQEAMERGFKEATKAWGKDLPDISQKTMDAANQLFENYYKSKETVIEE